MKRTLTAAALVIGASLVVAQIAVADDIRKDPGYFDLEWISIPEHADEIQDIDLRAVLLSLIQEAEESGDDAFAKALSMVRSVRVKSFSLEDEDTEVARAVEKVAKQLTKDGWTRLIYVKDDEETVTVSTRSVSERMVGLMLVAYEPGDSVAFVNVVGDLDLGTLLGLAKEFDSDSLDDLLDELDDAHGGRHRR